jgi:hypothetical protein
MKHELCFIGLTIALGVTACGNDNGGDVVDGGTSTPDGGADAGDVGCAVEPTFTSLHDVVLATPSCVAANCHNDQAEGPVAGSLRLSGGKDNAYMELLVEATYDTSSGLPSRVVANNPMQSFLYRKLAEDAPPAGSRMPLLCNFTNQCLPGCEIEAFRTWIMNGAPND